MYLHPKDLLVIQLKHCLPMLSRFGRDQNHSFFCGFSEYVLEYLEEYQLHVTGKQEAVLLKKRNGLNFGTLRLRHIDSRASRGRDSFPHHPFLQRGKICQSMVIWSSPTSRSWLSKQSSGAGFPFRTARRWSLSAVLAEVPGLLVPVSTTSISFPGTVSDSEKWQQNHYNLWQTQDRKSNWLHCCFWD